MLLKNKFKIFFLTDEESQITYFDLVIKNRNPDYEIVTAFRDEMKLVLFVIPNEDL